MNRTETDMLVEAIALLSKLVAIPSYRDGRVYEKEIGDFLLEFFEKELPSFSAEKQFVAENRFNVYASNCKNPQLLIIDHIDTVRPSSDWSGNPQQLTEGQDGKLFGLGSSDTKGNIAVLLTVLKRLSAQLPIAVLIYVDEEYEFLGMKKFISSPLSRSINPKAVLSVDGSGGKIGRGCRGVIEVEAELTGKAGHSANPNSGINAIERFLQVQGDLAEIISEYDDPFLGNSTLNVAGIEGGTFAVGNVIPDRVKVLLEVRTSTSQLDAVKFINLLTECSRERQLEVGDVDVKLDFGAFSNNSSFPANIQRVLKEELNIQTDFLNASQFGYLDLQMLSAVYPDTQLLSYGIGEEGQAHQADEFITKESILLGLNTFPIVIKSCLSNA